MKINIGPLPPPIGGISTYLYRLSKINTNEKFMEEKDFSLKKMFKMSLHNSTFVYHCFNKKKIILNLLLKVMLPNKIIVALYGEGLNNTYFKGNMLQRLLIRQIFNRVDSIEVVNNHIADIVKKIDVKYNDKIVLKCDRLPPPLDDERKILQTYNQAVGEFFRSHRPVIILNAFQLVEWNGIDLYGFDISLEALKILKRRYPSIGLFFALANDRYNIEYLEKMRTYIMDEDLSYNVYIMSGQRELWPLFKKASLFIRPTCTDGDALSIGEAQYFNCPVIASDVCSRPNGVCLFKNRNVSDLVRAINEVLDNTYHDNQ